MKPRKRLSSFIAGCLLAASFLPAQDWYFPYYGKNRVLYENFDWKIYPSEHFHVYFYFENSRMLKTITQMCEAAYERISQTLRHQLTKPVPLIYYNTFTDFQQTNVFQGIGEGVLGVSEPLLHRIGVYGDMPLQDLQDLIEHELTHVFQFDILWGNQGGALYALSQPPLWVFEGLSEYNTHKWSPWSALITRDSVLNDRIPELGPGNELVSRYPMPREPAYDFGHAIYEFMEERYGVNAIREFWQSLKGSPIIGRRDPIRRTFNLKPAEFNQEFKKYLRQKNREFLLRESPEDYSITLGPEYPVNPYYFSFSHAVSPSGELAATITYNAIESDLDIVLISVKDGAVIKNLTRGFTTRYEYIKFDIDMTKGRDLAWMPDGDEIAFFGRDGQKYSLYLLDIISGETVKKIGLDLDQPNSPSFFPDGKALAFTAYNRGLHDIYKLDLESGKTTNLTDDDLFEKAPSVSPDGQLIAYAIHLGDDDKLFLSPADNLKKKTQLTFGRGNTVAPSFSADSKTIYFSGDMRTAFNIYALNLETGRMARLTDVRTGNFFPAPLPNDPKKLIFSSFNKGAFQLFRAELASLEEETLAFGQVESLETLDPYKSAVELELQEEQVKDYAGLGNLVISQRPPIDTIIGSDGTIYGGSQLAFSDLLGDHNFNFVVYQANTFRSYSFAYLNLKKRLQWMASGFQYTLFYYLPLAYLNPYGAGSILPGLSYKDAIATRQITGFNLNAYYPLSLWSRLEAGLGFSSYEEDLLDPLYFGKQKRGINDSFLNGNILYASASLVGETTRFNPYWGPSAGSTYRLSLTQSLPLGKSLIKNTSAEADLRKYFNLGADLVLAFRWYGFASRGKNPYLFYYGGNNQVRSAYFYNLIATEGWYGNAELRFTLLASTPTFLGNFGPVRGTLFFDVTRSKVKGYPPYFYRETYSSASFPDVGGGTEIGQFEAMGSYGYGIQLFFLGLPIHLDWAKELQFPRFSDPLGVKAFGGFKLKFWIGFDF